MSKNTISCFFTKNTRAPKMRRRSGQKVTTRQENVPRSSLPGTVTFLSVAVINRLPPKDDKITWSPKSQSVKATPL